MTVTSVPRATADRRPLSMAAIPPLSMKRNPTASTVNVAVAAVEVTASASDSDPSAVSSPDKRSRGEEGSDSSPSIRNVTPASVLAAPRQVTVALRPATSQRAVRYCLRSSMR